MAKDAKNKNKEKSKKLEHAKAREKSYAEAISQFDEEVNYIRALQARTSARQRVMAQLAMEAFSSLRIQCAFRQYLARKVLNVRRLQRFIVTWARYHYYYRKIRRNAVAFICKFRRNIVFLRRMKYICILQHTAKKMIRWLRSRAAIKSARELLILKRIASTSGKRILLFGITRSCNKILNKIIKNEKKIKKNKKKFEIKKKSISKIINFFRKIIFKRFIQLIYSQIFINKLEYQRVYGVIQGKELLKVTFTANGKGSSSFSGSLPAPPNANQSNKSRRRAAVVPIHHPKLNLISKTSSDIGTNMTALPLPVPWNTKLTNFCEIIFFIISRIRPYDGNSGEYGGGVRDCSKVYEYLLNARSKHKKSLQTCREMIKQESPYEARELLKEIVLMEGAAGYSTTSQLVPGINDHLNLKPVSHGVDSVAAEQPRPGRRHAVSTESGIASAVGISKGDGFNNVRHREVSILAKQSQSQPHSLQTATNSGALRKSSEKLNEHEYIRDKITEADIAMGGDGTLSELYRGADQLPLPMEFTSKIFRPRNIFEILELIQALKAMVLAMSDESFDRITGKNGHNAIHIPIDNTLTQDCRVFGDSIRLGYPSSDGIVDYFVHISTSKLQTTSMAHYLCLKQSCQLQIHINNMLNRIQQQEEASITPNSTDFLDEIAISNMKIYTKPPHLISPRKNSKPQYGILHEYILNNVKKVVVDVKGSLVPEDVLASLRRKQHLNATSVELAQMKKNSSTNCNPMSSEQSQQREGDKRQAGETEAAATTTAATDAAATDTTDAAATDADTTDTTNTKEPTTVPIEVEVEVPESSSIERNSNTAKSIVPTMPRQRNKKGKRSPRAQMGEKSKSGAGPTPVPPKTNKPSNGKASNRTGKAATKAKKSIPVENSPKKRSNNSGKNKNGRAAKQSPHLNVVPPIEDRSDHDASDSSSSGNSDSDDAGSVGEAKYGEVSKAYEVQILRHRDDGALQLESKQRSDGRKRHITGGMSLLNKEQQQARESAIRKLQDAGTPVTTTVSFQTDYSSKQFASNFTRSLLLHLSTDNENNENNESLTATSTLAVENESREPTDTSLVLGGQEESRAFDDPIGFKVPTGAPRSHISSNQHLREYSHSSYTGGMGGVGGTTGTAGVDYDTSESSHQITDARRYNAKRRRNKNK